MMAIAIGSGALFLGALDFSINVNLPRFRSDLGETLISVQLIIIMYHGARSGTGFVAGGIADRFGIIKYFEIPDYSSLHVIQKYASCFKSKTGNIENLVTAHIRILMRKK